MACLLLQGQRPHRREALAYKLWPTAAQGSAASSFRTALWRLRRVLEPAGIENGSYLVVTTNGDVSFNWNSDFVADTLTFEHGVASFDAASAPLTPEQRIADLTAALDLYNGELLEGSMDDWVIYERERFRRLYLRGLTYMVQSLTSAGQYQTAISYCRKILAIDPLRESAQRNMLILLAMNGQCEESIQHYDELVVNLECELGVEPTEATKAVIESVLEMRNHPAAVVSLTATDKEVLSAVKEMQGFLDDVAITRDRLKNSLKRIATLISQR